MYPFVNMFRGYRSRLIFPIRNEKGEVVGFGARSMPSSPQTASKSSSRQSSATSSFKEIKYLNSADSDVFKKGEIWFGLDRNETVAALTARSHTTAVGKGWHRNTAIVVEGYMDVLSCAQVGVHNVVGALGTALSLPQLYKLSRYGVPVNSARANGNAVGNRVVLLMDNDDAGTDAAVRICELLLAHRNSNFPATGHFDTDSNIADQSIDDDSSSAIDLRIASMRALTSLPSTRRQGNETSLDSGPSIKDASDLLMSCGNNTELARSRLLSVVEAAVDWRVFLPERIWYKVMQDFISVSDETYKLMLDSSNLLR
jgi:5S rRNA maturation endonuclease (ribonuclease M5)